MNRERAITILEEARTLLIQKGWTKGTYARGQDGFDRGWRSPDAASYCVVGALRAASTDSEVSEAQYYLSKGCSSTTNLTRWNDQEQRTKEDVLLMFDRAIKNLKE